jgi:hypothetical protein
MLGNLLRRILAPNAALERANGRFYYDFSALAEGQRKKTRELQLAGYLDYPILVHLETITACNAACDFCPYPTVARKGNRMPDELIEKVIDDLTAVPPDLPFLLAPYKLSDPFLEHRLFDIIELVGRRLPGARVSLITNAAALTDRKAAQLARCSNIEYLNVSLNSCDDVEYEQVMKIPFARTLERLSALHARATAGEIRFPVRLTRVSGTRADDSQWLQWCRDRYAKFVPEIIPRNDWIGDVPNDLVDATVPNAPCHRWFDLSIVSTGEVAMCCMDGEAKYPKGDVRTQHVLDIYNQPRLRSLRESLISRIDARDPCNRCTYLSR